MEKKTVIIAFCGKGGVGKTSISALTIRLLKEKYPDKKILAIDADPAIGLSTSLGVEAASTVDDIRKLFIKHVEDGDQKAAIEMLGEAKYQIFDALVEINNISFLAIGRPESAGCYCKVNAYLKEVFSTLSSHLGRSPTTAGSDRKKRESSLSTITSPSTTGEKSVTMKSPSVSTALSRSSRMLVTGRFSILGRFPAISVFTSTWRGASSQTVTSNLVCRAARGSLRLTRGSILGP